MMEDSIPTDEELQKLEDELDSLTNTEGNSYGSPSPKKKDSTLVLFRELIKSNDSRKFGNLSSEELGRAEKPVRNLLNIAAYFRAEGLDKLANYYDKQAEITCSTSMSKKGWFGNLIVTQIKKEQKVMREPSPEVKRGIFGSKPKPEGVDV